MQKPLNSVCVYCGSNTGERIAYREAARDLGHALAEAEIRLVYGGGSIGLMGEVAKSVLDNGGNVTGIIPTFLNELEVGMTGLDKLILTENMHDRKAQMADLSDGFVVLPGGLGTLDETFEIITWRQLKLHNKPIVLVNVEGYWDHFVHLVEWQVREGFVKQQFLELFQVVSSIEEVLPALLTQPSGDGDFVGERS